MMVRQGAPKRVGLKYKSSVLIKCVTVGNNKLLLVLYSTEKVSAGDV
jgi:hypothetical protein